MEEVTETGVPTAGERLRVAREQKGLSLEDIAAQTRIPLRHLESIERGEWDKLPAPTYSIGFARSYASCVDVDRAEIADQLRSEMGGQRAVYTPPEVFEPADPARTMPKWLVFGAIAAVLLLVLVMTWLSRRSLDEPASTDNTSAPVATNVPAASVPAPAPAPAGSQGPVVLTAVAPAWVQVTDEGRTLFQGEMATGQVFQVPPTAVAPVLRVGAPEALRISVGNNVVPPVGLAGQVTSNVSLRPADLMRQGQQGAPATAPAPAPAG